MEPLIRVENLTKRFGGLVAVDEVSVEIFKGEVVGLVYSAHAGR